MQNRHLQNPLLNWFAHHKFCKIVNSELNKASHTATDKASYFNVDPIYIFAIKQPINLFREKMHLFIFLSR